MKVFVTGATGLLGNTIVRQLDTAGHETIAIVRKKPPAEVFDGLGTELVVGDLDDTEAIRNAVDQCDAVIHSAGVIHIGWQRMEESMAVNRDGTRNIVDACLASNKKLVHVGTVNTLAVAELDRPVDETTPIHKLNDQVDCSYVVSKRAGVAEVLGGVENGLRASIVHPGFMLGPWDWKPSSGRMMVELGKGWKPLSPPGGCSVCDSRDVAAGTIAAIEKGRDDGRQYILAGENWTYKKLWTEMAKRMGKRPPMMNAGPGQLFIGGLAGDLWAKVSGNEGDLNSAGVKMSSLNHYYDSSRAIEELGYQIRDVQQTLDEAAEWIRTHHMLGR